MKQWSFYTAKEIRPQGWLLRQLEIQARGLSGHLHKVWPDIRDSAWIGGKREGWERVPYWLDGFIPLAFLLRDKEMIAVVKKNVDAILAAQQPDGWICPCPENKRSRYDTWAVQLISKTLTVYYECSGDSRIPQVLYRVLKNYYDLLSGGKIRLFRWAQSRWFETFIALDFLYDTYGEDWIKDLARILKQQGYDYRRAVEAWKKPRHVWLRKTHIVNIAMMLKSEAVSCGLLAEPYTDLAETLRTVLDRYNGTAFEGFTGDEVLSGIDPTRGTELCAVVEQMYSYERLFACTGDRKWAERLEVLAFNALPATLSEDMWTHQYVQMVNQIACKRTMLMAPFSTNGPRAHLFGLEPNFGCCTANFSQGWPKFALSAFMHRDDTILNAVMLPCELRDNGILIRLETDYPFRNTTRYTVDADRAFTLEVRIPSFAENLKIDGVPAPAENARFAIAPGHTEISISFDVSPAFAARPNGLSAVRMGSLLFSVPVEYDKKMYEYVRRGVERKYPYCDYEFLPKTPWNYAFAAPALTVERSGSGEIPFSQASPPVTVTAQMQRIPWGLKFPYRSVCRKTPKSGAPVGPEQTVTLIPYGCAKLRMTEMPQLYR
ncbi:MAG: glycoside hydrolase family 127 protein [Clostridia bacterium]|nr:glycoside hydrolase family 127 protein [Clostridia bacterium]